MAVSRSSSIVSARRSRRSCSPGWRTIVSSSGGRVWRTAVPTTWPSRIRLPRECRCKPVLLPVSRFERLSAAKRSAPPRGIGRKLSRFLRGWEAGERKAGERTGGVTAPAPTTSARRAGSFQGSVTGGVNDIFCPRSGRETKKPQCFQGKHRGRNEKRSV